MFSCGLISARAAPGRAFLRPEGFARSNAARFAFAQSPTEASTRLHDTGDRLRSARLRALLFPDQAALRAVFDGCPVALGKSLSVPATRARARSGMVDAPSA